MRNLNLKTIQSIEPQKNFNFLSCTDEVYFGSKKTSEKQLDYLSQLGIKKVIDLKIENESGYCDEEEFEKIGIRYHNFSISKITDVDFTAVRDFSEILSDTKGRVLIYCMSGNRVGALMALYAALTCGHPNSKGYRFW